MTRIIKHPPLEDVHKWGILAHVEKDERDRILALPHGQFKHAVKILERDVDIAKFPRKKKSIVQDYSNKPFTKHQPSKEPSHEDEYAEDSE